MNQAASFNWAAVKKHFAIPLPLPTHFWNSNKNTTKTFISFGDGFDFECKIFLKELSLTVNDILNNEMGFAYLDF